MNHKPHWKQSLARMRYEKLATRYYGSFKSEKQMEKVTYKLMLPSSARIHPTFHVSRLRPAFEFPETVTEIQLQLDVEFELMVKPKSFNGLRNR